MAYTPRILIISGLSGSGKTVALRALEDSGYVCVDNIPPELISALASTLYGKSGIMKIAVGIDIRERGFLKTIDSVLPALRDQYTVEIVFLEAEKDILLRRFKETRRPHPLMSGNIKTLEEAISVEKGLLIPLRESADRVFDTSILNPHQLRHSMIATFGEAKIDELDITLISFGFKYGLPQNIDLLFDVRFLPNPHFVEGMRELDGTNREVRDYVIEKPQAVEFMDKLLPLLAFLIPQYKKEGKAYVTIGIGCTGGRHRSIAITNELSARLERESYKINVIHRDL